MTDRLTHNFDRKDLFVRLRFVLSATVILASKQAQ